MRKRIDTATVESPDSGIMDMSSYGFSPAFSKPSLNLSFEVERRRAAAEQDEGVDSSYYSTTSSSASASDFSPLDHIRDRILGVGHGRRNGRRRTALFDSSSPSSPSRLLAQAAPYLVMVVVLASAAFTAVTLTSLLNRDGGVWRTGGDPAAAKDLNGKYASMQFAHKARAKRLAEEGRLLPEDATVDEDGVQLGGKRAAILYAHRLREAAAPVVDTDDFNEKLERFADEAAKAEGETGRGGGEERAGGDIGDMDLKRTLEEIKRLQEEASSLRQENLQLKTAENDDVEEEEEDERPKPMPKPKVAKRSPKTPSRRRNPFRKTSPGGGAPSLSRDEREAEAGEDDPFRFV